MAAVDFLPPDLRSFTPSVPLLLDNGEAIENAAIAYQTWGTLNANRDNAIWVCHALTASSDVEQWWPGLFGPGRTLDPSTHFIVCANILGSCYGTSGPASLDAHGKRVGSRFPTISIADMVRQQRLLADFLGIQEIELAIGASMGGFQVLEWARQEPQRVRRLALIATSFRQPPQALAQAQLQLEFVRRDPAYANGDFAADAAPEQGLALARQLGHLTYRSADELDQRFGRERRADGHWQVLSYLDHQGHKLVRRFDAQSYVRLTEAMNAFDLASGRAEQAALQAIEQPALVVSLDSDQLYYPSEQARLARGLKSARLATIETLYGHDGFLVDAAKIDPLTREFLLAPIDAAPLPSTARRGRVDSGVPLAMIGATGRVGRELLALLAPSRRQLPLRLIGVANSRAALLAPDGLSPGLAAERLAAHSGGQATQLIEHLIGGTRPAILVDCTASEAIASQTARLLASGVSVVTPNKIAFAGAHSDFERVRDAAQTTPLGYSATVGAGLPAIATLARLRAAGDRILGIDAQLSGTLGFVLTRTQAGHSLRSALTDAVELGIAEPDPRIDLGGEDVRRKLAILLRAAGFEAEATRIELQPLLRLAGGAWQERIDEYETFWRDQVLAAHARHERLVYCARFDGRQARVGLASVPDSHPLAAARHTENRIVIHSEAHREIPIVIAGAGAGVRITAQSVMADIDDVCRRLLTAPVEAQLRRSA